MNILYIATRDHTPQLSGREVMISQSLANLRKLGHAVYVMNFSKSKGKQTLKFSNLVEVIINFIQRPRHPFQSIILYNKYNYEKIRRTVTENGVNIVFFDMVRTEIFAKKLRKDFPDIKIVMEVDDLLSLRYRRMLENQQADVLSHYGRNAPETLQKVAGRFSKIILSIEMRRISKSELDIANYSNCATMTSPVEAKSLQNMISEKLGKEFPVYGIPPELKVDAKQFTKQTMDKKSFVFLGNSQYTNNIETIVTFNELAREFGNFTEFYSAGKINPDLSLNSIRQIGEIADLRSIFFDDSILLAPISSGSGVKLKVVDAISRKVPTITTTVGIEGLSLEHNKDILVCNSMHEMRSTITKIINGKITNSDLSTMAENAFEKLSNFHNTSFIESQYRKTILE